MVSSYWYCDPHGVWYSGLTLTSFDASQLIIRPLSSSDNTFNFTSRESADEEELFDAFKMDMLVILDPLSPNGNTYGHCL